MNVSQFHEAYSNGVGQVSVSVACLIMFLGFVSLETFVSPLGYISLFS